MKRRAAVAFAMLVALLSTASLTSAATTPDPSASATPSAQAPAAPPIPKDFDPCGGPLELSNKLGNGTACVFVLGEAAVTAQYGSANIPGSTQLNFMSNALGLSGYAHAFGYPATAVYVGVAPRAEIVITPPSFVQVNSGLGTLAAGASDMKFEYKQLLYVNLEKFTMVALDLAYQAPTGSPALRGPGPACHFPDSHAAAAAHLRPYNRASGKQLYRRLSNMYQHFARLEYLTATRTVLGVARRNTASGSRPA